MQMSFKGETGVDALIQRDIHNCSKVSMNEYIYTHSLGHRLRIPEYFRKSKTLMRGNQVFFKQKWKTIQLISTCMWP